MQNCPGKASCIFFSKFAFKKIILYAYRNTNTVYVKNR